MTNRNIFLIIYVTYQEMSDTDSHDRPAKDWGALGGLSGPQADAMVRQIEAEVTDLRNLPWFDAIPASEIAERIFRRAISDRYRECAHLEGS